MFRCGGLQGTKRMHQSWVGLWSSVSCRGGLLGEDFKKIVQHLTFFLFFAEVPFSGRRHGNNDISLCFRSAPQKGGPQGNLKDFVEACLGGPKENLSENIVMSRRIPLREWACAVALPQALKAAKVLRSAAPSSPLAPDMVEKEKRMQRRSRRGITGASAFCCSPKRKWIEKQI